MTPTALQVEPARPADEPALRRLLRETPLRGAVSLSLEREPDFHLAAAVEGDRHAVVVARTGAGEVVALGTRSVRTVLVNGVPARVGYLGQLRAGPAARGAVAALRRGFAALEATRRPEELPFDLTSVVSDNRPARRFLEAGLAGFPVYHRLGELVTLALVARVRRRRPSAGLRVSRGSPGRLGELAALLAAAGARLQFAAPPTARELAGAARLGGLTPADFHLVEAGGRLAGAAAVWDQRAFKQAVVRGYAPPLSALRPLLSVLARPLGIPPLPPVGSPVRAAFLAFAGVAPDPGVDAEAVLDALLDAALLDARARGLDLLLLGLAADHPLLAAAGRRPHRPYRSTVYAVYRPGGAVAVAALDGRPLGLEVATL